MRTLGLILISSGLAVAADLNKGVDLYKEGKYAEAESELRAVVEQEPDNERAQRYLGLALVEQDKASDAARYLTKADELSPSGETKLALARLYVQQKDYSKAEAALKEASGEDLEYVRGLLRLNRKQYQQAAEDFESYLKQKPDHAYAHYYAGLAYNGARRPDKMLTHFEIFLQMKPDAPEARKVRSVLQTAR